MATSTCSVSETQLSTVQYTVGIWSMVVSGATDERTETLILFQKIGDDVVSGLP